MAYVGSLVFPRRDFSYVLKFQCEETGITGMRDSIVLNQALSKQQVSLNEAGQLLDWVVIPPASGFTGGLVGNLAEATEYDSQFPDHPLSRVRNYFREAEPTIRLADAIKQAPAFEPPVTSKRASGFETPTKKPWWRRWW